MREREEAREGEGYPCSYPLNSNMNSRLNENNSKVRITGVYSC